MGEVGGEFVALQAAEMMAHDQALAERFVDRHGEAAAQLGEADQQQAEAVLGVHGVVGQQAQIVEHVGAQELRLVDDEHRCRRYGRPAIVNTDQGSQFTSRAWAEQLAAAGIRCSMDGRGRCLFIERLWRSLKYEAVYLYELTDGFAAHREIEVRPTRHAPRNQGRAELGLSTHPQNAPAPDPAPATGHRICRGGRGALPFCR